MLGGDLQSKGNMLNIALWERMRHVLWVSTLEASACWQSKAMVGARQVFHEWLCWLTHCKWLVSPANLHKGWKQNGDMVSIRVHSKHIYFICCHKYSFLHISCFLAALCIKSGMLCCFRIPRNQFQFIEVANMMQDDQVRISSGCDMWDLGVRWYTWYVWSRNVA